MHVCWNHGEFGPKTIDIILCMWRVVAHALIPQTPTREEKKQNAIVIRQRRFAFFCFVLVYCCCCCFFFSFKQFFNNVTTQHICFFVALLNLRNVSKGTQLNCSNQNGTRYDAFQLSNWLCVRARVQCDNVHSALASSPIRVRPNAHTHIPTM